jgi:hypothetical protein
MTFVPNVPYKPFLLRVIMLNVVMLNVTTLSVIMLNVVAPFLERSATFFVEKNHLLYVIGCG